MQRPKWFVLFDENYMFNAEKKANIKNKKMIFYARKILALYIFMFMISMLFFHKITLIICSFILFSLPFVLDYVIKKNNDEEWFKNKPKIFLLFIAFRDSGKITEYLYELEYKKEFNALKKEAFSNLNKIDLFYCLEYCNSTKKESDLKIYETLKSYYKMYSEEERLKRFNKKIEIEEKTIGISLKNKLSLKIENN